MTFPAPMVRELERSDIERVLRRNGVGRIAFVLEHRVDVEPIHFAFAGGWIFGRTAQGAKLRTVQHDRPVAFHVDEIDGVFAWRSVVVHGPISMLPLDPTVQEREQWEEGLEALERLDPFAGRADDRAHHPGTAFRIRLDEIRGRCCGDVSAAAWDAARERPAAGWRAELHTSTPRGRDVPDGARF